MGQRLLPRTFIFGKEPHGQLAQRISEPTVQSSATADGGDEITQDIRGGERGGTRAGEGRVPLEYQNIVRDYFR